jgi:hypothetical protein
MADAAPVGPGDLTVGLLYVGKVQPSASALRSAQQPDDTAACLDAPSARPGSAYCHGEELWATSVTIGRLASCAILCSDIGTISLDLVRMRRWPPSC